MEKFELIFRGSNIYYPGASPEALKSMTEKMMAWVGDLIEKGLHVNSVPLRREGKVVSAGAITEGPFGDQKEVIGGSTIILAGNMDEATVIAQTCPILSTNATIEIRPLLIY